MGDFQLMTYSVLTFQPSSRLDTLKEFLNKIDGRVISVTWMHTEFIIVVEGSGYLAEKA